VRIEGRENIFRNFSFNKRYFIKLQVKAIKVKILNR